jgi:hypothetical protein
MGKNAVVALFSPSSDMVFNGTIVNADERFVGQKKMARRG